MGYIDHAACDPIISVRKSWKIINRIKFGLSMRCEIASHISPENRLNIVGVRAGCPDFILFFSCQAPVAVVDKKVAGSKRWRLSPISEYGEECNSKRRRFTFA